MTRTRLHRYLTSYALLEGVGALHVAYGFKDLRQRSSVPYEEYGVPHHVTTNRNDLSSCWTTAQEIVHNA